MRGFERRLLMAYQEKINIYVPHEIGLQLKNDAKLFEIFKKDKRTVNLNRFLTLVLCGYYDDYCHENKEIHDSIMNIIGSVALGEKAKEVIADQIVNQVFLPSIPKRKGKNLHSRLNYNVEFIQHLEK